MGSSLAISWQILGIELGLISYQFHTELRVESHSNWNWGYISPRFRVGAHKSPISVLHWQIIDNFINKPMFFYCRFRVRIKLSFMEKLSDWNRFKHYNHRILFYLVKLPVWNNVWRSKHNIMLSLEFWFILNIRNIGFSFYFIT